MPTVPEFRNVPQSGSRVNYGDPAESVRNTYQAVYRVGVRAVRYNLFPEPYAGRMSGVLPTGARWLPAASVIVTTADHRRVLEERRSFDPSAIMREQTRLALK